ncbi:MAG: 3-phosphoshikimate 1-carboxyvinyltransferase [Chlorobi bacterium]|nr:3-phosphoshikimate 1-carboxyvinyltransferase [Chlorobiota bacterium]
MDITLQKSKIVNRNSDITITGSKSESNRLLLLQALYPELKINNLSNSDDTLVMSEALRSPSHNIDVHHAGTAMRFLTAFFSTQKGREVVLTGSYRMQERPIHILVDALQQLGAAITYEKTQGYPPIKITGKEFTKYKVTLKANVSSQYISALMLIAPKLKNGLELTLKGEITSVPYINMTLSLLNQIGVETSFNENVIIIKPALQNLISKTITVESDWSSASYYYSIVALSDVGTAIKLSAYKQNSLQGDSVLAKIYKAFGVETTFNEESIILKKTSDANNNLLIKLDLSNAPDIAQTIAVTCLGLGIGCELSGLHTLKIKETDRLEALKTEIEKFGTQVTITEDALKISNITPLKENVSVNTYNDHRMAMAFAPLALKIGFKVNDATVVSKSYPNYWEDLQKIGFSLNEF